MNREAQWLPSISPAVENAGDKACSSTMNTFLNISELFLHINPRGQSQSPVETLRDTLTFDLCVQYLKEEGDRVTGPWEGVGRGLSSDSVPVTNQSRCSFSEIWVSPPMGGECPGCPVGVSKSV